MQKFETNDAKEVRRCRIAQFNGRTVTVRPSGKPVTGIVRSILEHKSSIPSRWTITMTPSPPKIRNDVTRSSPRVRAVLPDY
jgi:hypothetical protein